MAQNAFEKAVWLLFSGFMAAFVVLTVELQFLVFSVMGEALASSVSAYIGLFLTIFTVMDFFQSFLVGYLGPILSSVGFLVGILVILKQSGGGFTGIFTVVVVDLAIAFVLVLAGMFFKIDKLSKQGKSIELW